MRTRAVGRQSARLSGWERLPLVIVTCRPRTFQLVGQYDAWRADLTMWIPTESELSYFEEVIQTAGRVVTSQHTLLIISRDPNLRKAGMNEASKCRNSLYWLGNKRPKSLSP